MKFYEKNWFVILTLVIFFPLGLFLMWKYVDWSKEIKGIITGAIVALALISFSTGTHESETSGQFVKEDTKKEQQKNEEKSKENKEDTGKQEDKSDEENTTSEEEKVEDVAEKAEELEVEQPETMSKDEYKGVIRSYQSQIQLAGEDLEDLSSEMNNSGKTTNMGKDLIYAIYTGLDNADYILKGAKDDVTPPSEYETDHQELLEANQHFQNAARNLENFESSESVDDLNDALSELSVGIDNADINVRNILD